MDQLSLKPYPHTWEELDATPWQEISEEDYYDWLGCVPPARRAGTTFAVGEPACHLVWGDVVYRVCTSVSDPDNPGCSRYFTKYDTLSRFDDVKYRAQVTQLLAETVNL